MNIKSRLAYFFSIFVLLICCNSAMSETLVYERIYSHFELGNNKLRITLDEQGVMTVDRPMFMTHSGQYTFQVDPDLYLEFSAQFNGIPVRSEQFQSTFKQRIENGSIYISHPELSRFQRLGGSRNVMNSLHIESIDAQRIIAPNDRYLAQAAELEQQWWALMNSELARHNAAGAAQ